MYSPLILPDLRLMLAENDSQGLAEFCEVFYPAVTAEILEGLENADIWRVLDNGPLARQVEIFEFFSLPRQVELVGELDRTRLPRLLEEMSPDDRVDLLTRLKPSHVEALLPSIAQAERSDIRKLLSYPEESAGSIMTTEYASLPAEVTVSDAIDRLRRQAPDRETIYYVYIVDSGRRLQGLISLRELILAKPDAVLTDIMRRDVISVRVDDDQEFVAQELARYDFIAIPVVDKQNSLVGIVTHDDVLDVIREEATEDAHLLGAVSPLEDSYLETPLKTLVWKRGVWLLFLAAVSLLTANVLLQYESISQQHLWLVLFLPLVLASGGNAGSQSATLIIRAMALGEISHNENMRLARREFLVGAILGLSLATVGYLAATTWFGLPCSDGSVVALTVLLVVVMGTVSGSLLPLMFHKLGMDPALMSNPLIAALVDVLGVVIYYNVAVMLLK
ncbi:MAG: magnesium transporter [Planctomycetes bacterium]|nr:magnesium transporter [Planctomycetota bacterium]